MANRQILFTRKASKTSLNNRASKTIFALFLVKTQQISKQETSLNNKAKHSEQNPNHRQNYFILRTQSLSRNNQFYHDKKPNLPLNQPMLPQKQQEIPKSKSYRQTDEEPRYGHGKNQTPTQQPNEQTRNAIT